jgi:formate C-acetyltransferase
MIKEVRQKEEALKAGDQSQETREKIVFYQAAQIAMQGIIVYAQNLSKKAAQSAKEATSDKRKKHYQAIADVCAHVPAEPARTFREAVNSLWLCQVGIHGENVNMAMSPGRLDQVLYPYFKKDVEQGNITVEEALTLIGCLWLKISDNTNLVPMASEKMWGGAGSVPAVTLGGIDEEGKDAVNDLTYLMLRVTELLVIKDPNVNARYHYELNDKSYLERVSRVIINTAAIPAVYNDINNIATLENQGVTTEHARDYAVIGCVELGSAGREYAATSAIMFNLTAAMDMTLYNGTRPYITGDLPIGPKTGEPEDLKTFEEFQTAFETQLKTLVEMAIDVNNELGRMHQKYLPTPLLSCFFKGPLDKGKDLIFGGALYNSSGATHIGFADVCDSINAIEDAVYLKKKVTLAQMKDAVEKNFEGYEDLYNYVKNKAPKYGQDDSGKAHPVAVKNSKRLIKFLYDTYQSRNNYRGGTYRPAYWTMTNHAGLGAVGQALPSGRKANKVFSSGITPVSQCAKDLTGVYKCAAQLDSEHIPGGLALNMKYTPEAPGGNDKSYLKNFTNMIDAYFKLGGMQVQYNIQTYKTLEKARQYPKEYPELIVRVSGYSAYFKDLNKYMKEELITRTQYGLDTGKAVTYKPPAEGGK